MITAIDTSILLDVLTGDARFGLRSADALERCLREGALVACEVVWTETCAAFADQDAFLDRMAILGVAFSPISFDGAMSAAEIWRAYRLRGGRRERVAADFLIGAHALLQADRLLTRDRGFYRDYFKRLHLIDPAARS